MPKKPSSVEVTCPCCSAVLKVDVATAAVIAHTPAVKPKTFADMEAAAKAMREQDSRRKKAKETPDTGKPIRDFDLD